MGGCLTLFSILRASSKLSGDCSGSLRCVSPGSGGVCVQIGSKTRKTSMIRGLSCICRRWGRSMRRRWRYFNTSYFVRKSLVSIRFEERRFWKMRTKHWLFIYFVSLLLLFFTVGEIGRYFSSIFIKSFPEILWPSLIIKDFFFF